MSTRITRSGRNVKPVTRMIAESENSEDKDVGPKATKLQTGRRDKKSENSENKNEEPVKSTRTKRGQKSVKSQKPDVAEAQLEHSKNKDVESKSAVTKTARRGAKSEKTDDNIEQPAKSASKSRGQKTDKSEKAEISEGKTEIESSKETALEPRRGKRTTKPVKRMISESDTDSDPTSLSYALSQDSKVVPKSKVAQVENKSPVRSKRQARAKPATKPSIGEVQDAEQTKQPIVAESTKSKNDSDEHEVSFKKRPIYMKSFSPIKKSEDPYADSLESDSEAGPSKKKMPKKKAIKKPRKKKAQMILAFDTDKSQVAQALKRIKNLKTPMPPSAPKPLARKFEPPKINITSDTTTVNAPIQPKTPVNKSLSNIPSKSPQVVPASSSHLSVSPQAPPSMVVEDDFMVESVSEDVFNKTEEQASNSKKYVTPLITKHRSKMVHDRKVSTPRQEPEKKPTKKELMEKCFGFDDSTDDSDADQTRESLIGFSPVVGNSKSNHIMVTPMNKNPRGNNPTNTTKSKPMRFEFKMPRVAATKRPPPIVAQVQPPAKTQKTKSSFKVTPVPSVSNVEVSIFDDPYDAMKEQELNPLEMMQEAASKNVTKKPLKTVTNTAPRAVINRKTKQSLLYDEVGVDGQKQLKSKKNPSRYCMIFFCFSTLPGEP